MNAKLRLACEWVLFMFVVLALLGFVIYASAGCSTVRPKEVPAAEASFDGNSQNSGLIGFNADGSANITANARNRYNNLVELYGRDFLPVLVRDAGVKPHGDGETFDIDAQHLVLFGQMAAKYRSGIAPKL